MYTSIPKKPKGNFSPKEQALFENKLPCSSVKSVLVISVPPSVSRLRINFVVMANRFEAFFAKFVPPSDAVSLWNVSVFWVVLYFLVIDAVVVNVVLSVEVELKLETKVEAYVEGESKEWQIDKKI